MHVVAAAAAACWRQSTPAPLTVAASMQRWPCLLLMTAGLVMALIKLYERHERARFTTTHQVMLPMDRHKGPHAAADARPLPMPTTFETRFTAVSHGAAANVQGLLRLAGRNSTRLQHCHLRRLNGVLPKQGNMVNWTSTRKFNVLYPKHDVYLRVRPHPHWVPNFANAAV